MDFTFSASRSSAFLFSSRLILNALKRLPQMLRQFTHYLVEFVKSFLCRFFVPENDDTMDENEREILLANEEVFTSPLRETVLSLSNTPKGKIQYNRSPLSSTSDLLEITETSGFILSDGIFQRKNGLVFEKSFQELSFNEKPSEGNLVEVTIPGLNNKRPTLLTDNQVKGTKPLRWQEELTFMRNTNQLINTPVYCQNSIIEMFDKRNLQTMVITSLSYFLFNEIVICWLVFI